MLKHISVVPLAAESMGVRSMCTYVATYDVQILLDAGVSLCPNRFGLPPHPKEFSAIIESRQRITEAAEKVEVVTLSHYHFDHHTPSYEDWLCNWTAMGETARQIYEGKTVLMKNPKEQINYSQRRRAWLFQRTGGKHAEKLEIADNKSFSYGDTLIRFSKPAPHGPENSLLGWVLMTTVECRGEKFMFAPDVQGPISERTLKTILAEKPQLLMIGGPPLYLAGFKVNDEQLKIALASLERIVETIPKVIIEHHVLRDEDWFEKCKAVFDKSYQMSGELLTAAEYLGKPNLFLEAMRKRLFLEHPPSKDFEKWRNLGIESKKHVKPPI